MKPLLNKHYWFNILASSWDISVKFIYSEKATKICESLTLILSYIVPVKRRWRFRKILWPFQNIWTLTIKLKCSIGIKTKLKLKAEIWKKSYFPSEIIWPHLVCRSRVFVPFTGGGGEDDSSHFQFESIRSTIVNFSLSKILDCQTWFQFLAVWLEC